MESLTFPTVLQNIHTKYRLSRETLKWSHVREVWKEAFEWIADVALGKREERLQDVLVTGEA